MIMALPLRSSLLLGALSGAAVYYWMRHKQREDEQLVPAAAFAGPGAAVGSFTQVRDSGPEHMRDGDKQDWDLTDEASDQSFPASDPPSNY
jgi:hypothetical protein